VSAHPTTTETVDLGVELAPGRGLGLRLDNPILAAAGVFGYGVEYAELIDVQALGAICSKGTTLAAREGNRPPRMVETPAGLLNSIGLHNPGVAGVIERYAPVWAEWSVPVIVNIAAERVEDFATLAHRLDGVPGVAGIELNISCPNVGRGGLQFALDPDAAAEATAAARAETELPLIVKLSPAAQDVRAVASAVAAAGADAISAVNTLPGLAIDRDRRRPALGNGYGGLSGPALKPVALRVVYEIAQVVRVPIIGIGGVASIDDVVDYLLAGASAVQVGTAIFADPELPLRLVRELRSFCTVNGFAASRDLVGLALPDRRARPSIRGTEYRP
jgi:dihydroorotate dehydrogenase (NAD+) catalytic subunit